MTKHQDEEYLNRWIGMWHTTDTAYSKFLKQWDLSLNAYLVLLWLKDHPEGSEPAQIAEGINIQRQLVAIILRDFETRGWISRKERKRDHRRKCIKLIMKGLEIAKLVSDQLNTVGSKVFHSFDRQELEFFIESSEHFHNILQDTILKEFEVSNRK